MTAELEKGQLMISRFGKGTTNLYKAFQTKRDDVESKVLAALGTSQRSPEPSKLDNISENSDEDEAVKQRHTLGEAKGNSKLKEEMRKIEKESAKLTEKQRIRKELQAQQGKKARVTELDVQKKIRENGMKHLSSNFAVTSRDRHQFIFRNKTDPPDVGKYNPSRGCTEPKSLKASFPLESVGANSSRGAAEKNAERELENRNICKHMVKHMCTGGNIIQHHKRAPKADSRKEKSKEKRKADKKEETKGEDREASPGAEKKATRKHHRQGNTAKLMKAEDGVGFEAVVGHMPNGKALGLYSRSPNMRINQAEIDKLNNRSKQGLALPKLRYGRNKSHGRTTEQSKPQVHFNDAFFQTEEYHITHGEGLKKSEFQIIPNNQSHFDSKFAKSGTVDIHRFSSRPSIVDKFSELVDARFDNFNTSPRIYSKSKHTQNIIFAKQAGRKTQKSARCNAEFAEGLKSAKDTLMPRLSVGVTKFKKSEIRRIGEGFGGYYPKTDTIKGVSVCDPVRAQKQGKNSPRKSFATQIQNQYPRDLVMYQQTDFLNNIQLENSRDDRQKELDRMKSLRQMGSQYRGVFQPRSTELRNSLAQSLTGFGMGTQGL